LSQRGRFHSRTAYQWALSTFARQKKRGGGKKEERVSISFARNQKRKGTIETTTWFDDQEMTHGCCLMCQIPYGEFFRLLREKIGEEGSTENNGRQSATNQSFLIILKDFKYTRRKRRGGGLSLLIHNKTWDIRKREPSPWLRRGSCEGTHGPVKGEKRKEGGRASPMVEINRGGKKTYCTYIFR